MAGPALRPALKLAVSEPPIDINEANATEIREALPGIGEKLAMRIVAYRDEHGPYESASDLTRVQGINEKRVSLMANRISVSPSNSGYRRSAPETLKDDSRHPATRRFSINSDAMPGSFAPSLDSLLPSGPEEPNYRGSLMPSARPLHSDIGGSILSAAPPARRPTVSPQSLTVEQVVDTDAYLQIPLSRPWRVWVVLAALGLFSALGGAIVGVRSQGGGPRSQIERRVGHVQSEVANISGSVKQLESQATTFADSINALDSRISEQEQKTNPRAKVGSYATAKTPEKAPTPINARRDADESTRLRVREALTQFESALPPRAVK